MPHRTTALTYPSYFLSLGVVVLLSAGCSKTLPSQGKSEAPIDGHERMLALLDKIKDDAPYEKIWFEDLNVETLEAKLAEAPSAVAADERFRLNFGLGHYDLWYGRNQHAVDHFLRARDDLSELPKSLQDAHWEDAVLQLAVGYLRIAETENCVNCRTGESCILPIRAGGVHTDPTGSQKAIEYLAVLLDRNPNHLTARWLLNIAYMTVGGYPMDVPPRFLIQPEAFDSDEPFPRFTNIAAGLGLDTLSLSGGVIVDDFDNDRLLDLVVSSWSTADQMRYFRNVGDGTYQERTDEAGFKGLFGGLNLVQADYDNDGDVDILVLRGAWLAERGQIPNSLLRNDGHAVFQDVTFEVGLGEEHYPTQTAAWADYDNDGDLDLYVGNEGYPSQLFENDAGSFTDVADRAGVENDRYAKGVGWGDCNNDRFPDLYVSNSGGDNRLYLNLGNGTFVDAAPRVGVTGPHVSFAVWFWDFNNDGALDLFVPSYPTGVELVAADYLQLPHTAESDHLYQGNGTGIFREVAAEMNLNRVTQPMGANFGDLDNDGFPDFYLGTGYTSYEGLMPNLMFHNRSGTGFSDVTAAGGFGHLQKGHGVAFADLDNDGDQDVFAELGGAYDGDVFTNALFENPGFGNHWIKIKLIGQQSNRSAIGARVKIEIREEGTTRSIYQWVSSGGSFGANPLRLEIGLGKATNVELLEVFWPTTSQVQQFRDVAVNQFVEITEGQDQIRPVPLTPAAFAVQIAE